MQPRSQAQHAHGMAADIDDRQPPQHTSQPDSPSTSNQPETPTTGNSLANDDDSDASDDDSEPHFKYANLTSHLGSVYRNGDSASASLVSGDKLILGTHNGNVHVLSIPSLRSIRTYHAHDASITSISVSPYGQVYSHNPMTASEKLEGSPTTSAQRPSAGRQPSKFAVPATPSNQIYIATSSLDGCVCVSSLVDTKDVTVRNFKRPIQSVALSPDFKYDRAYLSAGLAGNLIHTTGGPAGVKTDANTTGAAAAASGWLSQVGLGSNTGKDVSIHSGEGAISTLSWSLSGKYVAWVNEQGIKIARTNLFLLPDYASHAWTRICHIDKPNRRAWEDMAGVWKARAQWVDETYLDSLDKSSAEGVEENGKVQSPKAPASPQSTPRKQVKRNEQLLVGWGDTVWVIDIDPKGQHLKKPGQSPALGKANFWKLELDDGIIAGLSLFTPTALLTLTYRTKDDNDAPTSAAEKATPKSGIRKRQNGLPPELRLISLEPGHEELDSEELKVRRFESLSVADYHLSTLYFAKPPKAIGRQRNALGQLSDGLWDASVSATTRLFNSGASVRSGSSDDRTTTSTAQGSIREARSAADGPAAFPPAYAKPGLKIFLISPFDCFMGVKRDMSDHLKHLVDCEKYQEAWNLLESNPEVVANQAAPDSRPSTPTRTNSTLMDFFDDSSSVSTVAQTTQQARDAAVQRERRRIGDMWIGQLVGRGQWAAAGDVASQALDTSHRWDHWISTFAEAGKFDEIVSHMPSHRLRPPISGALYELALGHYVTGDPTQLRKLIAKWDATLFDAQTVVSAIETRLSKFSEQGAESDPADDPTWRLLQGCLADLFLADGSVYDAVRHYIKAGDGDLAVRLVRENQLYTAISDQLYPFITVRINSEQLQTANQATLDELSADSIYLLAVAASQGLIPVRDLVEDLEDRKHPGRMFLFFYFRTLFNGDVDKRDEFGELKKSHARRTRFTPLPAMNSTRVLLNSYADLAVTLFADFDPALLNALIRTNDASADADLSGGALRFTFEHASAVCKARGLTSELVYLLALTGQTREALHLIADEMKDVPRAIAFAREMDDRALWNDLLEYSLDKPPFIKGLLEEVGGGIGEDHDKEATAIDPLTLVKKIPEKLEIEGLKEALARILKDSEVQTSISEGAARVLRSEVVQIMENLAKARARGVVFEVAPNEDLNQSQANGGAPSDSPEITASRRCTICGNNYTVPFNEALINPESQDYLLGFSCGHIVHLDCVLKAIRADYNERRLRNLQSKLEQAREGDEREDQAWSMGRVGPKITRVRLIREVLGNFQCRQCTHVEEAGKNNDT